MVDVAEVEKRTELVKIGSIGIAHPVGSVRPENLAELVKVSELFARSGVMVPPHCREKPGTCFALCNQALDWGLPYLAVINKSYVVNNRGVERIAYESQLIHAVIEKNAPLKGRLRYEITGEGDERRCKVWGTFRGEEKPHEYHSDTLAKLRDARGRNESGQLKGSPLWDALPEVQLFYSASRQWARLFCPDVILGAYTPEDQQFDPIDVTPDKLTGLSQRLKAGQASERGFDQADVARQVDMIIEGDKEAGNDTRSEHPAERKGRPASVAAGDDDAEDGERSGGGGAAPDADGYLPLTRTGSGGTETAPPPKEKKGGKGKAKSRR